MDRKGEDGERGDECVRRRGRRRGKRKGVEDGWVGEGGGK